MFVQLFAQSTSVPVYLLQPLTFQAKISMNFPALIL